MIFIGDELVPCEETMMIFHKDQIAESKPNSTVLFNYNSEILGFAKQNSVSCGVIVSNITQALYCNALDAKYIVCSKDMAKEIQVIAENYMFDSKILAIIDSNNELPSIASNEIDGVIYKDRLH